MHPYGLYKYIYIYIYIYIPNGRRHNRRSHFSPIPGRDPPTRDASAVRTLQREIDQCYSEHRDHDLLGLSTGRRVTTTTTTGMDCQSVNHQMEEKRVSQSLREEESSSAGVEVQRV